MSGPYSNVNPSEMILRDHLAYDRTVLANERTLLAYVRTAIALFAGGAAVLEVFAGIWYLRILGLTLLVIGTLVLTFGIWRFAVVARRLRAIYRESKPPAVNPEGS